MGIDQVSSLAEDISAVRFQRSASILRRRTQYCEPKQTHSAVREPINAWSNIGYSLVGAWSFAAGMHDLRRPSHSPPHDVSTLRGNPGFSLICGTTWLCLGMFSFLFHAANTRVWQMWDVGFTNNAAACMAVWSICSLCLAHVPPARRNPRATTAAFLCTLCAVETCLVAYKWRYSTRVSLSSLIGGLVVLECIVQPLLARRTTYQRVLTALAILSMLVAWVVRELEANKRWGRPWCLWHDVFQPHSLWHLLSAAAIALQLASWRLPLPPPPRARRWRCCPASESPPPAGDGVKYAETSERPDYI
jgi:hypothetical protein